ncbi:MAG: DUF169 domain-containing protein [Candidatus Methanosuratincola sp.]|jgi:uncharacterized protein (DUF169 family)|nr:DUF169 domain-containing protein [Candidatus Methanosuratincola sp.]
MKQNYATIQKKLTELLGLKFPPIAVSLVRRASDVPQGVAELEKPMFYCAMVKHAMLGNVFFARDCAHACRRGAAALGLAKIPDEERTGEFYTNKSSFASPRAATRSVEQSPGLAPGSVYATLISPLEKSPIDPDVVLMETLPRRALEVVHASLFERGGWVESLISAPRQVCAALTVRPYLGDLNISFACESARMAAKPTGLEYSDDGVLIGIPGEQIGEIAENIDKIGYVRQRLAKK